MNAQEIIDKLDEQCYEWFEPIINPSEYYSCVADTRLTIFRAAEQWVLCFEIVQYNVKISETEVCLYLYGNCLRAISEEGGLVSDHLRTYNRSPFEFDAEATAIDPETGSWILNRDGFSVWLKGQKLEFQPTAEEYRAAGVIFDRKQEGPDTIKPEQLLRFLCWRLDHAFFNSEDYLRSVVDAFQVRPAEPVFHQSGLSHHLSLFLQTREWQHTDFDDQAEYQCPSEVPGFHILARTIASGDLTEWNSQDPATFNTDWRPWEAVRIAERAHLREQVAAGYWISDGPYPAFVRVQVVETTGEEGE